jgi:hypothetical protein
MIALFFTQLHPRASVEIDACKALSFGGVVSSGNDTRADISEWRYATSCPINQHDHLLGVRGSRDHSCTAAGDVDGY